MSIINEAKKYVSINPRQCPLAVNHINNLIELLEIIEKVNEVRKPYYQWLKPLEEIYFKRLMKLKNNNQSKVAIATGLNRGTIRKKLKQYNLNEYREITPYWEKRLEGKEFNNIYIKRGYPKKDDKENIIIKPWKGYIKTHLKHKHFGDKLVNVYAIIVN